MVKGKHSECGVTMVELLVSIGIIMVLSALIYSAVANALAQSKSVACLANIRSYGSAVLLYIADHDASLPWWDGTSSKDDDKTGSTSPQFGIWVAPYLNHKAGSKGELRCPLRRGDSAGFFYTGNAALCQHYPRLIGLPVPANRVVLATEMYSRDSFYIPGHLNRTLWGNGDGGADPGSEGSARPPQYHPVNGLRRGLNMFFLDGHAALLGPTDNDWRSGSPTYGDSTNGGYFYDRTQFRKMREGTLSAQ